MREDGKRPSTRFRLAWRSSSGMDGGWMGMTDVCITTRYDGRGREGGMDGVL